jgi:predicted DNA-binding protein YlxM (UPF0122 family)
VHTDDLIDLTGRYRSGESIAQIAVRVKMSPSTVRRQLLAAGVTLRPAGTVRVRPDRHELQQHLVAGRSRTQIANTYNVTRAAVSGWINYHQLRDPAPLRPTASELIDLHLTQQLNLREIGTRYNVTKQAVRGWLAAVGVAPRHDQRLSPETEARIVELYLEHQLSCGEIGRTLSMSTSRIDRVLRRHSIQRRRPLPALLKQQLEAALAAGTPVAVIAQDRHCSQAAVYRALKRAGLKTERQRQRAHAPLSADRLRTTLDNRHQQNRA